MNLLRWRVENCRKTHTEREGKRGSSVRRSDLASGSWGSCSILRFLQGQVLLVATEGQSTELENLHLIGSRRELQTHLNMKTSLKKIKTFLSGGVDLKRKINEEKIIRN